MYYPLKRRTYTCSFSFWYKDTVLEYFRHITCNSHYFVFFSCWQKMTTAYLYLFFFTFGIKILGYLRHINSHYFVFFSCWQQLSVQTRCPSHDDCVVPVVITSHTGLHTTMSGCRLHTHPYTGFNHVWGQRSYELDFLRKFQKGNHPIECYIVEVPVAVYSTLWNRTTLITSFYQSHCRLQSWNILYPDDCDLTYRRGFLYH